MHLTASILVLGIISGTSFVFSQLETEEQKHLSSISQTNLTNSTTEKNEIDIASKENQTASNSTQNQISFSSTESQTTSNSMVDQTASNSKGNEVNTDSRGNLMAYKSKLRQLSYYNSKRNHTQFEHQLKKTNPMNIIDKIITMLNGFHIKLSSDFLDDGGVRIEGKVEEPLFETKDKNMKMVAHADYSGVVLAPNSSKGVSHVGIKIYD